VRFVDIHTHMVPSGDDGVATIEEGLTLCREAARRGTSVLYVTPHVNEELPLTSQRETSVRDSARELSSLLVADGLEIRVGFELNPAIDLTRDDARRYSLDGYSAVLIECPLEAGGTSDVTPIFAAAENVEAGGLLPILAHPERSPALLADQGAASEAAGRGWLLQLTAASLMGRYGSIVADFGWSLLEAEEAHIVASDGHRPNRPPYLDEALSVLSERLGRPNAVKLLDASALERAAT
jgi:protein-tyrosine phosphatase